MSYDGTQAITGRTVGADTYNNSLPLGTAMFLEEIPEGVGKAEERLTLARIKILYHNEFCLSIHKIIGKVFSHFD
jgi:hypothetical protein